MKKIIRYGIVGTGIIAEAHANALRSAVNSKLVAVYDKDPERAGKFAQRHGGKVYNNYKEFLSDNEIDAVSIAVPSGLHMETAIPAAEAGKHILCEKPLDVSLAKAQAIIDACRKNNVQLSVVFQLRFGESVQKIKKALDLKLFGRIVLVSMQLKWFRTQEYYDTASWRGTWELGGGGVLMTQAIHDLDLMLYLNGFPSEVTAYASTMTHTGIEVEDNAAAVIRWPDGALGVIEASTSCAPGFPRRLEISGEKGSVIMEDGKITRWKLAAISENNTAETAKNESLSGGSSNPSAISAGGHQQQFEDLSEAILTGKKLFLSGEDGLPSLRFLHGIYESAKRGIPVKFTG